MLHSKNNSNEGIGNKQDILEVLESINFDYLCLLNSREYKLGKRLFKLRDAFRAGDVKKLKMLFQSWRIQKKTAQHSDMFRPEVDVCELIESSRREQRVTPSRIPIYSCITSGYDCVSEPRYIDKKEEFILFTDKIEQRRDSIWQQRNIIDILCADTAFLNPNRYCKLHPYELFPNEDAAIYIDGNVQVISDLTPLITTAFDSPTGLAMHRHPFRSCVYDEAFACIRSGKGNKEAIKKQVQRYRDEGFPEGFGLYEATVIAFDLRNKTATEILTSWWEELCRSNSGRDQLSLPYIIWKSGFAFDDVGILGEDVRINPLLRVLQHRK